MTFLCICYIVLSYMCMNVCEVSILTQHCISINILTYIHPIIHIHYIHRFLLCYVLCPLLGLGLGRAFKLPVELVAGLVLVGSINGGQASNLCTYIAKGDVALSVLMTTVTTIAGIYYLVYNIVYSIVYLV